MTTKYLVNADEPQIKMAKGAKPGEARYESTIAAITMRYEFDVAMTTWR